MSSRSANCTIKGFFYQFEKTLEQLLIGNDSDEITVEGIEDIDTYCNGMQRFMQCKYHEQQEKFSLSKIEEPIMQMLLDWSKRDQKDEIRYMLFCHFPNEDEKTIAITSDQIKDLINKDTPKKLVKFKEDIRRAIQTQGNTLVSSFIDKFAICFGPKLENLKSKNQLLLANKGFNETIINDVIYPSAMAIVHELSIKHEINERQICIRDFWEKLKNIDSAILHKYTKLLKNYDDILKAKRKYLKSNLKANTRTRCFVLDENSFNDYENTCVIFIKEFLDNYQKKPTKLHINSFIPIFAIYSTIDEFKSIQEKLLEKKIKAQVGFLYDPLKWKKEQFFATPVISVKEKQLEFNIRLLYLNEENENEMKRHIADFSPDDLYIINTNKFTNIDISGNKELLNVNNVKELKYLLNMVGTYD